MYRFKYIISTIIAICLLLPMLITAVGAEGAVVERPDKDKYVNNQILFRIKEYPDENNIEKLKDEYDFIDSELVFDFDKNPDIKDRLYCATVPDEYDVVDLCSEFKKYDYVSSTYLNCYGEYTNLNDNSLLGASSKQWHMHDLNMYEAWKLCDDPLTPAVNESGDGTVIAVIDTGFDFTNPALQNSFIKYNDTDENQQPVQYNCYDAHTRNYVNVNDVPFHGTMVASCIAASGSDSPVVGVAPGARILPVSIGFKVNGLTEDPTICDLLKALCFLCSYNSNQENQTKIDILSMSLKFENNPFDCCNNNNNNDTNLSVTNDALSYLSDVVVFASTGNYGLDSSVDLAVPAGCTNVIAVSAYGADNVKSDFSNFDSGNLYSCNVAGPGQDLYMYSYTNNSRIVCDAGTSFSTPIVASIFALYISKNRTAWDLLGSSKVSTAIQMLKRTTSGGMLTDNIEYEYNENTYTVPKISALDLLGSGAASSVYSGTLTGGATWSFDQLNGRLTVTGSGAFSDFAEADDAPWWSYRYDIEEAILVNSVNGTGITNVPDYMFSHCENLVSVTLPNTVEAIGDYSFDTCRDMATLTGVSNVESVGEYAFVNCTSLPLPAFSDSYTHIEQGTYMSCYSFVNGDFTNITQIDDLGLLNCNNMGVCRFDRVTSMGRYVINSSDIYVLDDILSASGDSFPSIDSYYHRTIYCYDNTNINSLANTYSLDKKIMISPVNNNCVIDRDLKLIYGLSLYSQFSSLFTGILNVQTSRDVSSSNNYYLGTGLEITLKDSAGNDLETFTTVIFGDLNGDGTIDSFDTSILMGELYSVSSLTQGSAYYYAADLTNFGNGLDRDDLDALIASISGYFSLLQTPNYGYYEWEE